MRNEFIFYRDARGEWRFYWLIQLPLLSCALFLNKYGHLIGSQDSIRDFAYIALGLSFIFQFAGIFHFFGLRTRILAIDETGLNFQIDPLYRGQTFEIKWTDIVNATISPRVFKKPINLLRQYGPALGRIEVEKEVLAINLKSPLPSHFQDLIKNAHKGYFSRAQIGCNKDGKEIWVIEKPAGGYYRLLGAIEGYLSTSSNRDIRKPNAKKSRWYISFILDLILASGVLVLNYFSMMG